MLKECSPVVPKGNISSMLGKLEASIERLNDAVSSIDRKLEPFTNVGMLCESECGNSCAPVATSHVAASIDSKAVRIDEIARRLEYIRQAIDD